MQIVIDIDENLYTRLFDNGVETDEQDRETIETAIRKGTSLSKGMGDLDISVKQLEEFEKAQIITGGRLNVRTYAYKCGFEDGQRKALEQEPTEWQQDHEILKAYSDGANEVLDKIRAEIEDLRFGQPLRKLVVDECLEIIDKYKEDT